MAPTFLIVGATGNTGRGVTETLPKLLKASKTFPGYQILALTRSKDSTVAKQLSQLPNVEIAEQNWTEITAEWLRENEVVESSLHRTISRTNSPKSPRSTAMPSPRAFNCKAYYARTHWAIETMLSSSEYKALQWTSLQPNMFLPLVLYSAVEYIKQYRKSGKLEKFATFLSSDAPVGAIEPTEVGIFAAHLLAQEDRTAHNNKKHVLHGPEDISGQKLVKLIEGYIGAEVKDVEYENLSFIDAMTANTTESKNVVSTIKYALDTAYAGECSAATTSKEVLQIAPPKRTAAEVMKEMLG